MVLTNAEKQRRYRERLKAKAAKGDIKAVELIRQDKKAQYFRSAKSFIKNHATLEQLTVLREIILNREKYLKENNK
ncbi:hypothetical protein [Lactobacillus psittaci]|uniref:Uncharacterized protein n=1 Tax=Lactobacillus psittaci DSM 15354 TaxID=1122152 RepID=A0A0R1SA80_9LACO|nr:hypothetical protein [Lactobacillus psittaci]KRL63522.1 hypothetical protein FC23_GL000765 [Lactobacillus psittaci DSM 15354]